MSIAGLQNSIMDLVAEIETGLTKEQIKKRMKDLIEEIE